MTGEVTWGPGNPHPTGDYDEIRESPLGGTIFGRDGYRHRLDGPAVVEQEKSVWYVEGEIHRVGGPAVEHSDGMKEWWVRGVQHREDGPAIVSGDGGYVYFVHGRKHREDGPASVWSNGSREWWVHGIRHRLDGPAIEYSPNMSPRPLEFEHFYIEGERYTEAEHAAIVAALADGSPLEWAIAYATGAAS